MVSERSVGAIFAFIFLSACGGQSEVPPPAAPPSVFIGDSITELWGVNPVINYSPNLADHVPGSVNKGVSDNTTTQMLARFNSDVLVYKPSVVHILGGTNDALNGDNPIGTTGLFTMVNDAEAAGARVIVGTIPLIDFDRSFNPVIVVYNNTLRSSAALLGYVVVDYAAVMANPDGSPNSSLYRDGLHPNGAGYAAMWRALKPVLRSFGVETVD
jgi:lysophospholipase L1-like esterase